MGLLGFGKRRDSLLVAVMYEGPGRLRLNGNRIHDARMKQRATAHPWTVCWLEFADDGVPQDQGLGPAAGKLESGTAERLLRELPQGATCRQVLQALKEGRDQSGKWLQLGATPRAG